MAQTLSEKMIPNKNHYTDSEKYPEEVFEFTKKPLEFFKEIATGKTLDYSLHGKRPNYDHYDLISFYNHPVINAIYIARAIYPLYDIDSHLNSPQRRYMRRFKEEFASGKKVCDFGCGVAVDSLVFHDMGYKVVAVELPLYWFRFLEFRFKKYNIDIDFRCNWDNKTFLNEGEEFDLIFSHEVMEHIVNPDEVIAYLVKHLKIGGIIYLTALFTSGGFHLYNNSERFGHSKDGRRSDEWQKILEDLSLENIGDDFYRKIK